MTLLFLFLALAQPGECADKRPGLSQCVEYKVTRYSCEAVCYWPSTWKKDGGTDSGLLRGEGETKDACRITLERQCADKQKH